MRKFVKNILLFLLPILILLLNIIPVYLVAVCSGEIKDIDKSINKQRRNHKVLIGFGYSEQKEYYKLSNANYYKAKVIALGTSRVMQFKKEFFGEDFYNCGGAVSGNYNEYVNFMKNLSYEPEVLVVGLDTWVFNDAWNQMRDDYEEFIKIEKKNGDKKTILKTIYEDWENKKWVFEDLRKYTNNVGFNGIVKDEGFMYDGSYYYGDMYRNPEKQKDYLFADTLNRIETGTSRFEWGEHIDQDTFVQLENLLSYCKERNILVVGFLTPYAPAIYDVMINSGNYNYLNEIVPACVELFDRYEYEFYNYMDGEDLGATDDYFIDGFHGSEILYGHILEDMILNGSRLKQYADFEMIQYMINNSFDNKVFLDPDERNGEMDER